ncbi:MAG: MFS transporter, partial [Pseudomonadales bacterium]|nr:MFS transporter [Pseudomonadales bacterium]
MSQHQTSRYLTFVVVALFLVNFVNYMDRMVLSVVIEPIKAELELSDTQIGLLTGLAFAIFYGTAGLFIAWLADRYNRKVILTVSMLAWSVMTA